MSHMYVLYVSDLMYKCMCMHLIYYVCMCFMYLISYMCMSLVWSRVTVSSATSVHLMPLLQIFLCFGEIVLYNKACINTSYTKQWSFCSLKTNVSLHKLVPIRIRVIYET